MFDLRSVNTTIFMVFAFIVCLCIFSRNSLHIPYGDGVEYVMMTESLYNHQSPELRNEDASEYINYLEKRGFQIHKIDAFRLATKLGEDGVWLPGYYKSKVNGNWYSYHFWMYSVVCVPARFILEHLEGDIRATGLMTNLFLIFWGMWLILRLKQFTQGQRIILALFLAVSPTLFYIDWIHSEVFSAVLVFMAVVYYSVQRKYLSLFLFSLAATQNPTLAIPALFIFIEILYKNGIKWKVLLLLFVSSFWIVLPALFYKHYFGVTSLISNTGLLQWDVVSFRRLWSFFFDLNQGIILGIPLLLFLLIGFLIYDLIKWRAFKPYLFLVSILVMSLFFMQMTVWNDGNSVIKRYAVWCIPIIIVVFFLRTLKLKRHWFYILGVLVISTQVVAIASQQSFYKPYWHGSFFNKLGRYALSNYPDYYNPEPVIFKFRLKQFELSTTDSVFVYTDEERIIQKMLIKEGSISQLELRGLSKDAVQKLDDELNYRNGYAYVNRSDLIKYGYSQEKDTLIQFIEKNKKNKYVERVKESIRSNKGRLDRIKNSSVKENITLDSALNKSALYIYELELDRFEKYKMFDQN